MAVGRARGRPPDFRDLFEGQAAPQMSDDDFALFQGKRLELGRRHFGVGRIGPSGEGIPWNQLFKPAADCDSWRRRRLAAFAELMAPLRTTRKSQAAGLAGSPPC